MIKQVGRKYEWTYVDCIPDEDQWVAHKKFRPFPFDMTLVKVKRAGKVLSKEIPAWWTGEAWKGRNLKKEDQVIFWKLAPKGDL